MTQNDEDDLPPPSKSWIEWLLDGQMLLEERADIDTDYDNARGIWQEKYDAWLERGAPKRAPFFDEDEADHA